MSVEAITWAWSVDGLTAPERLMLIALADYADDEWSCFPGQEKLATRVCVSKRTVIRLLQKLEAQGVIRRERRNRPDGSRTSDRFFLIQGANLSPDIHDVAKVTNDASQGDTRGKSKVTRMSPYEPSVEPSDKEPSEETSDAFEEDARILCQDLIERIKRNGNRAPSAPPAAWVAAASRLMRLDGYTLNQCQQVLAWSQDSEFWQGNILSMPKFREKFDTLKHQMFADQRRQRGRSISNPAQARIQNNLSVVAQLEAEAELNERVIAQ